MELGISSFGEVQPDGTAGNARNAQQRMQELLEEIKLADEVGLDVYALGEHHRPDFIISAPEVILGAAAAVTKRIKLSTAVTVLSSADPVRVFQQFATIDLLSGGRAEIMAGRGSFIESFPLFGYDLKDYDALFTEKLGMLMALNEKEVISWRGQFRPPVHNQGVYPRPYQASLPIWLGAGGTPASAARAGKLNLPLTIALLGGTPEQFVPFVELYRKSARDAGHDIDKLQLAICPQFYVAEASQQAADEFYPSYEVLMNRVGKERGWSPLSRPQFEYLRESGPLVVGDVQQTVEKILYMHELFGNTRFLAQFVTGYIPHKQVLKCIELFGTQVAPAVRKALNERKSFNV
ncbi:LLM class flavin-dependent oxidoreductase [Filimonas effusa]|uniref:LLM class flavin-dependent oxidoreductase n=1 Tax=Filimonas effusa TaxID=2508721 RepID=A0A4V1M9Z1_9BACT|nr:LLM class flavin-dependent oxidoreductase [Filimonas effusa]RXK83354.1 LLM class flavin-dependent oxidoreductase [Filimonas effusa]